MKKCQFYLPLQETQEAKTFQAASPSTKRIKCDNATQTSNQRDSSGALFGVDMLEATSSFIRRTRKYCNINAHGEDTN